MKSLKTIRESVEPRELPTLVEFAGGGFDMPVILVAKRKAIRQFPDGQAVGLYYIKQIDRFITIPQNTNFGLSEAKSTVSSKEQAINDILVRHGAGTINKQQASRLLKNLGVLNPDLLLREEAEIEEGVATAALNRQGRKEKVRTSFKDYQKGKGERSTLKKDDNETSASKDKEGRVYKAGEWIGSKIRKAYDKNKIATSVDPKKKDKDPEHFKAKNIGQKIGHMAGTAVRKTTVSPLRKAVARRLGEEDIISTLQQVTEDPHLTSINLPDGTEIDIDYATAANILEVFNNLNEDNQVKMLDKMQTEDGFDKIKEFSLNR